MDAFQQSVWNIGYHRPTDQRTQDCMEEIRQGAKDFLGVIYSNTMYCRETQMAYTNVEQAVMNAIAGLARQEEATLADLETRGLL